MWWQIYYFTYDDDERYVSHRQIYRYKPNRCPWDNLPWTSPGDGVVVMGPAEREAPCGEVFPHLMCYGFGREIPLLCFGNLLQYQRIPSSNPLNVVWVRARQGECVQIWGPCLLEALESLQRQLKEKYNRWVVNIPRYKVQDDWFSLLGGYGCDRWRHGLCIFSAKLGSVTCTLVTYLGARLEILSL